MNMPLLNKRILITAGPTREWMDPVRFLTNPSSGAMGLVLAKVLKEQGASVTVVLGPTVYPVPAGIRVENVESAIDMFNAVKKNFKKCDAFIATAAVGDWRFKQVSATKLKKSSEHSMSVTLVKNPDILAWAGNEKRKRPSLPIVGFALETDSLIANAEKKLKTKNVDAIVANGPASFGSNAIHARWIEVGKPMKDLKRVSKERVARHIAQWLEGKWKTTPAR